MPLLNREKGGILGFGVLNRNPQTMFKNSVWEAMERQKRAEWTAKGYSPHLQNMAIDLAHSYAAGISPWVSSISGVSKEEIERKLYSYGLDTVAESWIQKMSK